MLLVWEIVIVFVLIVIMVNVCFILLFKFSWFKSGVINVEVVIKVIVEDFCVDFSVVVIINGIKMLIFNVDNVVLR